MKTETVQINLENGLDAKAVAWLVQEASKYDSKIYVETDSKKVNAKSMMGMMILGLNNGEKLTVTAEGEDEELAVKNLNKFLTNQ